MKDDLREEMLLDARICATSVIRPGQDGWQERYCECIDQIAERFGVPKDDLVSEFLRYHNPLHVDVGA